MSLVQLQLSSPVLPFSGRMSRESELYHFSLSLSLEESFPLMWEVVQSDKEIQYMMREESLWVIRDPSSTLLIQLHSQSAQTMAR